MSILVDTNIAIYLRDGEPDTAARINALNAPPSLSIVTRIELEGGVHRMPPLAARRRARLDELLTEMPVLDFTAPMAGIYGNIVQKLGYSRPRILDRMIAATAIVHGLTLITINADDFRGIPGLALEIWPAPAQ